MKIGIIVYSQTGNTRSVADQLVDKLAAAGHSVTLQPVEVARTPTMSGSEPVQFTATPDPAPYEAIVFGGQVHGFSLSRVMGAYLQQVGSLEGKPVACLITQSFPYAWLGGNRAVRQMSRLCEAKGARISGSGVVNWMGAGLDQRIARVTDALSRLF